MMYTGSMGYYDTEHCCKKMQCPWWGYEAKIGYAIRYLSSAWNWKIDVKDAKLQTLTNIFPMCGCKQSCFYTKVILQEGETKNKIYNLKQQTLLIWLYDSCVIVSETKMTSQTNKMEMEMERESPIIE